ncbi:hypothetical protein KAR91_09015 [Candidatus Pacearchaeota archaeon]|nr:hypothetical protein [Candidatus Pacearchaeota archaeon]
MGERTMMDECYQCVNKRPVPGNCHIDCANPDPEMTGDPHGMKNGWFIYPFCFDPVWKTKDCVNFESKAVSDAVSGAVSESKAQ